MTNQNFISIQAAAKLSDKSVQTIRRAVKAKKLVYKKKKTPQGFNYSIDKDSLIELYELEIKEKEPAKSSKQESKEKSKEEVNEKTEKVEKAEAQENSILVTSDDFKEFKETFEKIVAKHSEERQNFLRLINTLQEKIFVLENQINLLKAPKKKWYQVWK